MPAARSMSSSVQIGSSSISGTVEAAATAALASQSSESQGCSNSSIRAGSSAEANFIPCSRLKARLASSRSVARFPTAF